MSASAVKAIGQCTECGRDATHSHECRSCHVESLVIVAIKGKYNPDKIRSFAENFIEADLFKVADDQAMDSATRYIASLTVRLSLAHRIMVRDVQRRVARRLEIEDNATKAMTPEQKAEWRSRIAQAFGHLTNHLKTI